jgi:hypothetical protein
MQDFFGEMMLLFCLELAISKVGDVDDDIKVDFAFDPHVVGHLDLCCHDICDCVENAGLSGLIKVFHLVKPNQDRKLSYMVVCPDQYCNGHHLNTIDVSFPDFLH